MPQKTRIKFSALAVHSQQHEPHAATPHITHTLDASTDIALHTNMLQHATATTTTLQPCSSASADPAVQRLCGALW